MSYDKAMKHTHNVRKVKKQSRQYMGFAVFNERVPAARSHPYIEALLNVRAWFATRHSGDRGYNRECIREAIADCRRFRNVTPQPSQDL